MLSLTNLFGCLPAFSRDTLLESRWLLQGAGKANSATWNSILTMDEGKQVLFMCRILLLHELTSKRAGKSCSVRLSQQDWNEEADRMCLVGHIITAMLDATQPSGDPTFDRKVVDTVARRAVEGRAWRVCR